MKSMQAQLEAFGLGEKEVKVYLAALELGSATVQEIAAKSAVVRASAYVAIGGLTKLGLMSTFTKGKKAYFSAEPPVHLLKLVHEKKRKLAEQESKLKEVMPELQALISLSVDKPEVKYYEGLEGLEAMREKIFESKAKELKIIGVIERVNRIISEESFIIHNHRLNKAGIKGKYLLVSNEKRFSKPSVDFRNWDYRILKSKNVKSGSEIAIFGEYISMITYQDRPYGVLIKSSDMKLLVELIFDGAWSNSSPPTLLK